MTELIFVDTTLWVYAGDLRDARKQQLAEQRIKQLWRQRTGRISVQVLNEYYATITRKCSPALEAETAWSYLLTLMTWNPQPMDQDLLRAARDIERRYGISWWDATIVAAAQAQRCNVLLSEDFADGVMFEQLRVENPFATQVQEPRANNPTTLPRARHRPPGRPAKIA